LPPPRTINQLQSLQGEENLFCSFIVNYKKITKCFVCLLKKGVPFVWDDQTQCSFYSLNMTLMSAPLLSPLDYGWDCFLYLVAFESTIGIVFFQKDNAQKEHVISILAKVLLV
jgi:hypothetical protein